MPKRTNDFQQFVLFIERALIEIGATVRESEELRDQHTGALREVDIVVRHQIGTHDIVIAVECTATGRPATVEWIEQLHAKHASLPIDKLILVSKSGYTADALAKAKLLGIDALTFEQAEGLSWPSTILDVPSVEVSTFVVPVATAVSVLLNVTPAGLPDIDAASLAAGCLSLADGSNVGSPLGYINQMLSQPTFRESLLAQVPEGSWDISGDLLLNVGADLLLPDGRRFEVGALRFRANCQLERRPIPLRRFKYGDAAVVHGDGTMLGRPLAIAMTQQPGESGKLTLRIENSSKVPVSKKDDTG